LSRSVLRGFGLATAALVAAVTFGSPAYAADTGTIAGTITDAGGTPVPSASVQASGGEDSSYWGSTDAAGHYSIEVPAGSGYRVSVQADQHPLQYAHGKINWADADVFSVATGGVTTVDESFLQTGIISGRFTYRSGAAVVEAYVQASSSGSFASTMTAPDGTFSMPVLPGSYRVSFSVPGLTQYVYGTLNWEDAALFTVAAGQTVTVEDSVIATGSVAGHIAYSDGNPAAWVSVSVNDVTTGRSAWAQTDGNGSYRADGLPPGDYSVSVQLSSGAREWVPQKLSPAEAGHYAVTADAVTAVDETLPAIGSIAGRFTDADGAGMAWLSVTATPVGHEEPDSLYTSTGADGSYRFDQVFVGGYRVGFQDWETNFSQWAFGKASPQDADVITVTDGQTTTVNDSRLPTGSLRVTATDSLTGAPINDFEAYLGDGQHGGQTSSGTLVIADVPAGQYPVAVTAPGYAPAMSAATVTIVAGEQAEVSVALRPLAKITTKVVDKKTGLPVADVCVLKETSTKFLLHEGCVRSDADGNVTVEVAEDGSYTLFALPDRGSKYGAQWVGAKGGVGSQAQAASVTAVSGQTVTAPTVKLDPSGVIKGKVASSVGAALSNGFVGAVQPDFGSGDDTRYSPIAADGSYTVDWLGPYKWPLFFTASDHAGQWSGGTGNRLAAESVQVRPGQTTVYDYTLQQGTSVKITLADGEGGRFLVHNAVTGDILYIRDSSGTPVTVDVWILSAEQVKLHCYCGEEIWHGGTDFASATAVTIPATGPLEIAFQRG